MDEKLKIALQDYVATVNSGKYGDDYTTLISKFPELTGFEKQSLDDYVATSNSGKYGDDWDLLNSKFPEFTSPKQNEVSGTGSKNTSGTSTEPSKTSQKPSWIQESGDVIQDTKGTTKFDLGLNRVEVENLQFEEPLIDEKTGRPLEVTYQAELTPGQDTGERSYLQNLENSLNNNLNQLKGFDERIVVTAGALSKKLLPIVGSSAEELYQYAGLDFNAVMDTAINELDRLAGETLETANFTDANNAKDFFSALTDSVLAVVNSGLVASTTYGVGLFTDMVGGSISEANSTKADRLGISVEDLYRTNQEDFYAPAILGSAGYLLERYGLKGVKQAINRKISSGLGRYLSTVAIDNNKEGVTEWLQYGGDSVNTFLAEGGRVEDAGEIFADALFSKQGLEMYLKGMAGSTAISAPSVIVNSISNSKTRTQAYKLDTERRKLIQELQNEFIAQNPITRDAVLTKIESISDELNALYSQDLTENKGNLTVEQTEEVNTLSSQISEIEQAVENPEMSEEVKTALNEEKNTLQTKIDEVISNSNKQVQPNEVVLAC